MRDKSASLLSLENGGSGNFHSPVNMPIIVSVAMVWLVACTEKEIFPDSFTERFQTSRVYLVVGCVPHHVNVIESILIIPSIA